jgi:hypothetical protein
MNQVRRVVGMKMRQENSFNLFVTYADPRQLTQGPRSNIEEDRAPLNQQNK